MNDSCKNKDCAYWRDTPLGDSHHKCITCCHSAWLPKPDKDNYKPNLTIPAPAVRRGTKTKNKEETTTKTHTKNPAAVALGRLGGLARTAKKAAAARENGKKGGRPKGSKNKPKPRKGRAKKEMKK